MGIGILMCGLNGAGKSTLGKALAEELSFRFIDNENLYFPKTDSNYTYASPRTREEVEALLESEIKVHEDFVFTSVRGDYGEKVRRAFKYAVLISVPRDIRLERVRERSFRKFGERMLPGGDLYEQEKSFFDFVSARPEDMVEEWIKSFERPVIRVDGTRPVEENVAVIIEQIKRSVKE